jgi:hypothetical protein
MLRKREISDHDIDQEKNTGREDFWVCITNPISGSGLGVGPDRLFFSSEGKVVIVSKNS